jgi:hypothetical protein
MLLGKYYKAPDERKRYSIDYADWLDTGELVNLVTFEVTPVDVIPLVIDGVVNDTSGRVTVFYASGGTEGRTYKAIATMESSGGQIKEDTVQFIVRAP